MSSKNLLAVWAKLFAEGSDLKSLNLSRLQKFSTRCNAIVKPASALSAETLHVRVGLLYDVLYKEQSHFIY